jgi:hypothetical protein
MLLLIRLALVFIISFASPAAGSRLGHTACTQACGKEISDASFRCVDRCMR